jgi:nicotinamidase-related amidase
MDLPINKAGVALLCIDLQVGILSGCAGARQAAADQALAKMLPSIAALQSHARALTWPVIHVQHEGHQGHRLARDAPGWPLWPSVATQPGDHLVTKRFCDAFYDTPLKSLLDRLSVRTLVVVGCMSQFCIDTTCRNAVSHGYDVILVADGHMNAGTPDLSFEQIIAHHNTILDGLDAGTAQIRLEKSQTIIGSRTVALP